MKPNNMTTRAASRVPQKVGQRDKNMGQWPQNSDIKIYEPM